MLVLCFFKMAEKMDFTESVKEETPLCLDPLDLLDVPLEVLPEGPPGPDGLVTGPSGQPPSAAAGAPAPKPKSFSCTACPRVFGEKKRLKAHWETAHAVSFEGFECPHAGCTRAFHREHRQHLKIHLKAGHGYSSEDIAKVMPQLTLKLQVNAKSDGKAAQVVIPACLAPPQRTPAQKRRAPPPAGGRPFKAPGYAVGERVMREVVQSMTLQSKNSVNQQDHERAAWKATVATLQSRISDLVAQVSSLTKELAQVRSRPHNRPQDQNRRPNTRPQNRMPHPQNRTPNAQNRTPHPQTHTPRSQDPKPYSQDPKPQPQDQSSLKL